MCYGGGCSVSTSSDNTSASLTQVTISGTDSISATGTTELTANPVFSGTVDSSLVTYSWSITDGSKYASFSSSTTKNTVTLKADNTTEFSQTVKVLVSVKYGGTEKTATKTILLSGKKSEIKDNKIKITISYSTIYGTAPESKTVEISSSDYSLAEDDLPLIETEGYDFLGWTTTSVTSEVSENVLENLTILKAGDKIEKNTTFYAVWTANTNTAYTVKHFLQPVSISTMLSDYEEQTDDTQTLTGTIGGTTAAAARTYAGFTAKEIAQSIIAGDGSTVVSVYYDRKEITLTLNLDGGIGVDSISGAYGTTVNLTAEPTKDGYTFSGWSPSLPDTFPAENANYTAEWTINGINPSSVVNHIKTLTEDSTVVVVGELTEERLKEIASAISTGNHKVILDLSNTTGLVKISGTSSFGGSTIFSNNSNLVGIMLPNTLTTIGGYVFKSCALENITIPDSVTSIEGFAFFGCSKVKSVYYTGTLEQWISIKFDSAASNPCSETSADLYIGGTKLTKAEINDVKKIGDFVFTGYKGLESVSIGEGVESIGNNAFDRTSLTSVTIPDSVITVGDSVFYNCARLRSVTIGKNVTKIGKYAFSTCSSLVSATFKDTTTWYRSTTSYSSSGTAITSEDLSNTSTAANYLKSYFQSYWFKQ